MNPEPRDTDEFPAVDKCGSKMCEAFHTTLFGRCYCALPKGHEGVHDCQDGDTLPAPVIEHRSWHLTIPEQGFCWCIDCQRTVWNPPVAANREATDGR